MDALFEENESFAHFLHSVDALLVGDFPDTAEAADADYVLELEVVSS